MNVVAIQQRERPSLCRFMHFTTIVEVIFFQGRNENSEVSTNHHKGRVLIAAREGRE